MKSCQSTKKQFISALYNELDDEAKTSFYEHLQQCAQCKDEFVRMQTTMDIMTKRQRPPVNDQYWDQFWFPIMNQIQAAEQQDKERWFFKKFFKFNFNLRWAVYPLSAIFLILTGIYIGKILYVGDAQPLDLTANHALTDKTSQTISPLLNDHLESIRPMLIECANFAAEEDSGQVVLIARKDLKKLLTQNYLLKKMISRSQDQSLKDLLEELELILVEMSNQNEEKGESQQMVQKLIQDNDLLFKMNIYTKGKSPTKI